MLIIAICPILHHVLALFWQIPTLIASCDGAARSQRWRHFPGDQRQRRIPWRDGDHHAQRLVFGVIENIIARHRYDAAADLVGQNCLVIELLRNAAHLRRDFGNQLAVVVLLNGAEPFGVTLDQSRQPPQQRAACGGSQAAPGVGQESAMRAACTAAVARGISAHAKPE